MLSKEEQKKHTETRQSWAQLPSIWTDREQVQELKKKLLEQKEELEQLNKKLQHKEDARSGGASAIGSGLCKRLQRTANLWRVSLDWCSVTDVEEVDANAQPLYVVQDCQ